MNVHWLVVLLVIKCTAGKACTTVKDCGDEPCTVYACENSNCVNKLKNCSLPVHDCCSESLVPMCNNFSTAKCVCNANIACCTEKWSRECVNEVKNCREQCFIAPTPANSNKAAHLLFGPFELPFAQTARVTEESSFFCDSVPIKGKGVWYEFWSNQDIAVNVSTCNEVTQEKANIVILDAETFRCIQIIDNVGDCNGKASVVIDMYETKEVYIFAYSQEVSSNIKVTMNTVTQSLHPPVRGPTNQNKMYPMKVSTDVVKQVGEITTGFPLRGVCKGVPFFGYGLWYEYTSTSGCSLAIDSCSETPTTIFVFNTSSHELCIEKKSSPDHCVRSTLASKGLCNVLIFISAEKAARVDVALTPVTLSGTVVNFLNSTSGTVVICVVLFVLVALTGYLIFTFVKRQQSRIIYKPLHQELETDGLDEKDEEEREQL